MRQDILTMMATYMTTAAVSSTTAQTQSFLFPILTFRPAKSLSAPHLAARDADHHHPEGRRGNQACRRIAPNNGDRCIY
jgi:hypothetical protein